MPFVRLHQICLCTIFFLGVPCLAQDADDDASNYAGGAITQLDQGTGWQTAAINISAPSGIVGTATAGSAVTDGGNASMDISSQSWVFKLVTPGNSGATGQINFTREIEGTLGHATGEQLRFRVQSLPPSFGGAPIIIYTVSPVLEMIVISVNAGVWQIGHSGGTTATTVDVTTPQEVVITNQGSTVNVRFTNLDTSATESYIVTPTNTGNMGRITASLVVADVFPTSQTGVLIMNQLQFSETGGLPVELQSFDVE